jgi:hypothetical protein
MNHGVFEAASWMHCRWNALFHRHYVDLGRPRVKLRIMFDITIRCIGTSQDSSSFIMGSMLIPRILKFFHLYV